MRFHGVFAPHSRDREAIVPGKKNHTIQPSADDAPQTESEKRIAMNWARRLKRAFQIDIQKCEACGGKIKIIACIEDPTVINQILSHLNHFAMNDQLMLPLHRGPPLSSTSVH